MKYIIFFLLTVSIVLYINNKELKETVQHKDETILSLVQEDSEDTIILREANRLYKERGYVK